MAFVQVKRCTKLVFVKVLLCCAGEAVYQNGLCEGPGNDGAHPASPGQRQVRTVSLLFMSYALHSCCAQLHYSSDSVDV